jgi:hypothetical protein
MNTNMRTVTLKLPRGYVCKLLVLLSAAFEADPEKRKTLDAIRLCIRSQLDAHDEKWKEKDA